ncbi:AAA family ATPase [Mucilaginibacter sp. SG564]|uniref:AAA family ATPase n=1 Tax=Mucilaginibacter sp. SG564 TaxID=2587022 RepID=UPI0015575DA1|nr:AAA family ATPase [Mucilaginibacter sp. SG564]NOW95017.1 putative ATPase [Mucilaginibacter sp. SG564]
MDFKPYLQTITFKEDGFQNTNEYPFNIPAFKNFPTVSFHRDVTFIVGENGSGKSTFIESLSQWLGISREGGSKHGNIIERAEHSLASSFAGSKSYRRPKDYFFLRAESLYNVASYLDEIGGVARNYGVNSLHECSHGESFLAVMANRLGEDGLYLFDEPEAALSPVRQITALSLIDSLVKRNSQLIIATHSPILLAYPHSKILQFDDNGITEVKYEQTEQYLTTKTFLDNYKSFIERLV